MNAAKIYCGTAIFVAGLIVFCVRHLSAVWLAIEHGVGDRMTGGFEIIQKIIGTPLLILGIVSLLLGFVLILMAAKKGDGK